MKLIYLFCFFVPALGLAQGDDFSRTIVVREGNTISKATIATEKDKPILQTDLVYHFYFRGKIHSAQGSYTGNLLHGAFETYYENNSLMSQGNYYQGLKHGRWKQWYHNGNLELIETWKKGKREGEFEHYNLDGSVSKSGKYKNGQVHGKVYFFSGGDLQEVLHFENGQEKVKKQKKQKRNQLDSPNSKQDIGQNTVTLEQYVSLLPSFDESNQQILDTSLKYVAKVLAEASSEEFDFSPVVDNSGNLMFLRKGTRAKDRYNIYKMDKNTSDSWATPFSMTAKAYKGENFGPFCILSEGRLLSTFSAIVARKKHLPLSICECEISKEMVYGCKSIDVGAPNSTNCHPAFYPKANAMVFSSDRLGGFGGMDLYITFQGDSGWLAPINLGATINTKKNELFPTFDENGRLFFSSESNNGFGGQDIYLTFNSNGKWVKPILLPLGINSDADDFGFISDTKAKTYYFSSNRKGSLGKDDLYIFKPNDVTNRQLMPDKRNSDFSLLIEAKGQRLDGTVLRILPINQIPNESLSNYLPGDAIPNDFLKVKPLTTDQNGERLLNAINTDVVICVEKSGYITTIVRVSKDDERGIIPIELEPIRTCTDYRGNLIDILYQTPIEGGTIKIVEETNKQLSTVVLSDMEGNFRFCVPCNKNYLLEFIVEKMEPDTITKYLDCSNATFLGPIQLRPKIKPQKINKSESNTVTNQGKTSDLKAATPGSELQHLQGRYHLIAGVFSRRENALKVLENLKSIGYTSTNIRKYNNSDSYFVCVGIFESRDDAKKVGSALELKHKIKIFIKEYDGK
jgi:antitoxin component YwqK of YwqJK toxin-antitoxin module